ncbi:MAG: DNA polymerase II large subunit [Candidatus Bathyarchaeota archaeon]|nr:MAG: DNA polymerase II large subunit [Candidatus Bathyarchaeota archaeon]
MQLATSPEYEQYFAQIEQELDNLYNIARRARLRGLDPSLEPESQVVKDFADRIEQLVGPPKVAERIRELGKKIDKYKMAFIIADDIVHAKFGHTNVEDAAGQAIRTSLAVTTGGITAAPIQGIAQVRIKQNSDRSNYLALYFAGPIRSAGGTEQALTLVIGDYVRKRLGLARYKPTNDEIHRFIEEVRLYEREIGRFQYHVSDEQLAAALKSIPVEVTGIESDPLEVSSYRNLPRIETNRLRGGTLRVVNDGLIGRSQKVLRIIEQIGLEGWEWLKQLSQNNVEAKVNSQSSYMDEVIAGRPVFSFPSRSGGFRLRYGRSRNTGLAALGVHPATMAALQNFIASGTQIRIEGPGKGGIVLPVNTIEPPIVKLKNGSVLKVESLSEYENIEDDVEEILFLGDLLTSFGEFLENNRALAPSGYTEEWWIHELWIKINEDYEESLEKVAETTSISLLRLKKMLANPFEVKPTIHETIALAKELGAPIHPAFTHYWNEIDIEELSLLRRALLRSETKMTTDGKILGMELSLSTKIKNILEKLRVPHRVNNETIIINQDSATILAASLMLEDPKKRIKKQKNVVETIKALSGIILRDKGLTYIGARMGRPEKAKKRMMSPPVHVLFPLGLAGGSRRNILNAVKKEIINVEVVRRQCPNCKEITYKTLCLKCGVQTIQEKTCPRCNRVVNKDICQNCNAATIGFNKRLINIKEDYEAASKTLNMGPLELVKGVKGLTSSHKTPEPIEKGILRAKYDLSVFKDGTIRFDATNAPLTHFKPSEIGISIEQLKNMGYTHDMNGSLLQDPNQICELKIQDVIVPRACIHHLIQTSKFLDELLEKFYRLTRYYEVKNEQDLIGRLIVGFAPHTSAGIIGRILGFTKAKVCYAHPLWHNVKRRDCDGDEDALMFVLDILLNFSKPYLPARIGGMMDEPLLLISIINPFEVDEVHNLDVGSFYPLAFYEKTLERADPNIVSKIIDTVGHRLGSPSQFEGYSFTHMTDDVNAGNLESAYVNLGAMTKKLWGQLLLAEKIRAVESNEVAKRVLTTHFLRDIAGNLRAFTKQKFRCKKCNTKYRRTPIQGKCVKCGGELLLTVHKRGIQKYLNVAEELVQKYDLETYYRQRIELIKDEINSIFGIEKIDTKQAKLGEFM